jgi:hypothetical protein
MTAKKIRVSDFDFDTIKADFKNYLSGTPEFTDYNFEGSNLNVLFDILAYNTHYTALMANFVANEMYIDTAAKRSSVVSHAKKLGYLPKSATASKAVVNVIINTSAVSTPTSLVLPAGTRFISSVDGETYIFSTTSAYTSTRVGSNPYSFTFFNVNIFGGTLVRQELAYSELLNKVEIMNSTMDSSTLTVRVDSPDSQVDVVYNLVSDVLEVNGNSKIFYLQEGFLQEYEVLFGDNILGERPIDGSVVSVEYIAASPSTSNGAKNFTLSTSFGVGMPFTSQVITLQSARGAADRESIDSVRFNAVNYFGSQNRAVITNDYKLLVSLNADNVKSVLAWGGEDNVPPKFGHVMLCIIPDQGELITPDEEVSIRDYIKTKSVANTIIEFVPPEYLDLVVDTTIVYDKTKITTGVFELESAVRSQINEYAVEKLSQFGGVFRYSTLIHEIDISDPAIINNTLTMRVIKELIPTLFELRDMTITVGNALNQKDILPCVVSTGFFIPNNNNKMFFEDDRNGKMKMIYYSGIEKFSFNSSAGTVDYTKGIIYLNPIEITSYDGDVLSFNIGAASNDLVSTRNVVLRLKDENITVKSRSDYV